jgi:hypothetical protein
MAVVARDGELTRGPRGPARPRTPPRRSSPRGRTAPWDAAGFQGEPPAARSASSIEWREFTTVASMSSERQTSITTRFAGRSGVSGRLGVSTAMRRWPEAVQVLEHQSDPRAVVEEPSPTVAPPSVVHTDDRSTERTRSRANAGPRCRTVGSRLRADLMPGQTHRGRVFAARHDVDRRPQASGAGSHPASGVAGRPAPHRQAVVALGRGAPASVACAQAGPARCLGGVQTGTELCAGAEPDISAAGAGPMSEEATATPTSRRPNPEE